MQRACYDRSVADADTRTTEAELPDREPSCATHLLVIEDAVVRAVALPVTGEIVLGRSQRLEVPIDHVSVSRRHARLRIGASLEIEDLGSRHGTHVRGRRLAPHEPARVHIGDTIQIGRVTIVIRFGRAPDAQPREPACPRRRAELVIADPAMRRLASLAERIAATELSILILGETGVGKEALARLVHASSPRAAGPLLTINCAALPEALVESELFGHERGAFTGAVQVKPGLLEAAGGGSLLLDEIGDLPLTVQAKLLRAIEERAVRRVGGLDLRPLDVRLLAATNRDLAEEVERGRFRRDLYFRLNGIALHVPPLRARRADIPVLARHFLDDAARRAKQAPPDLTPAASAALQHHAWPGNVRELRNVLERAVVLASGCAIDVAHLGLDADTGERARATPPRTDLRHDLEAVERTRIVEALARHGGNQKAAARELGISRPTLLARLDRYGIARPRKR